MNFMVMLCYVLNEFIFSYFCRILGIIGKLPNDEQAIICGSLTKLFVGELVETGKLYHLLSIYLLFTLIPFCHLTLCSHIVETRC